MGNGCETAMLLTSLITPPGCPPPPLPVPGQVWRLRFIVQSSLAPGRTMADHAAHLAEHHAYLNDLHKRVGGGREGGCVGERSGGGSGGAGAHCCSP